MTEISADERYLIFALSIAFVMAAVVGTALVFEHVFGYLPCYLCLLQRTPYYIGIPVALVAAAASWLRWPVLVTRLALIAVGLLMAYGAVLSGYHAGVEWRWWEGPADCGATTGGVVTDANNLLAAIEIVKPPSCDEAALRVLGLSFAGWNVLVSVALALWVFVTLRGGVSQKSN
ncbi:MAG: disulfide bond formation protein B [Pseudomonadota bacterium]